MTKLDPKLDEATKIAIDSRNATRRKKAFTILGAVVTTCSLAYWAYDHFYASHFVSTDNAYTGVETAQVTPAISGIVREVRVADTQSVRAGDIVVLLDDTDATLAVEQAEAELGRAVSQIAVAQADYDRAKVDLDRRVALAGSGSVSGDELTKARNSFETAKANRAAADAQQEQARANRDQTRVNLERTVIRAPVDGVVAKRSVQVGQQVQAGVALLSVVPLSEVHVDANFKEGQLTRVKPGQPVEITADIYGDDVIYHGTVEGLSGGTGAAFATIPAQNATGNWIKVVQRVPVRIKLDPAELAANPLQVGLSMVATIDTREATPADAAIQVSQR